ncbi:tRNA cytosine-5-methylases and related enzymes of the NOL1/NOP2/sun superfamily [Handroanthus impetiginosus]|uniref:tRNA cytosine-5-methylases and related enzymes of the NOL1/NOP2/sun superfamily n=1 Tax=Handroanthus impetiginosus TaxID=429701 RepID=A0A2G9GV52_9LAMI|nr:tRNA cytosine-5-methylases and related enzymes of the NOL1/NOP2/sun superfamily [Handroanthus impetiginosus]
MGGRGRSRTQRKHFRQSRENVWKRPKSDDSTNATPDDANNNSNSTWEPFATQNPAFDEYYKVQEIVSPEEWDSFIEYLRKPLPAAFRINSSSQFYVDIRLQLENDFMKSLQAEDADGIEVDAIKPLPWYPENLAWQSNFSRNQLRKNQTLERFHEFLKLENEIGNITRQEAVSMVPPLFLDVRPEHFVLDMCAAPGSKTFQLLEMIYKLTEPGTLPSGMVIANDLDVQRCNLLIHQTKRMCTANLIVTNHEAQHFPSCHLHRNHSSDSQIGIRQLQFDRVLCDVPCSGDGTLRKAPDIWRKWNAGMGNGLHGLQVQIAMRGVALLKVGGRMVYSTCSMNPVENEAVVAEVLRRCGGAIELLDVSTELPQLARRPGLKKWKVRDKGLWLASYKDVPKYRRSVVTPGMFPSGKLHEETSEHNNETATGQTCENGDGDSKNGLQSMDDSVPANHLVAEVSDLPLERCMRIVPHDQNSGSFFIAVFRKLSPLPAPAATGKKPTNLPEKTDPSESQPQKQMNDMEEESNGDDTDLSGVRDVQISEATPDANILGTEMNEAPVDTVKNKISEENEKEKPEPSSDVKTDAKTIAGKRKLQMQGRWRGVDPVIFYKDDAVVGRILEFYGIKESFPFKGHLITRNNDMNHVKRIYYVSDSVKKVLELNFLAGQQLKIASVGLKMFERQTSKEGTSAPCIFRISSEGLPLILPHIAKQILYASAVDFKHLLQYKSIKFADFVDPEFGEKASKLLPGCCVVVLNREAQPSSDSLQDDATPIAVGCWRGRTNISVMVTAIDCQELLGRVSMLLSAEDNTSKPSIPEAAEERKANDSDVKGDNGISMAPATLD